jgi:predicted flap endonuclease-1-like 5' DNA nuclease
MERSGGLICTLSCWGIGALVGLISTVLLMVLGSFTFMQGAFFGALVFLVAGAFLSWSICRPLPAPGEVKLARAELPRVQAPTVPRSGAVAAPEPVQPAALMEEVIEKVTVTARSAVVAAQPALDRVVEAMGVKDPTAAKAKGTPAPVAKVEAASAPVAAPAAEEPVQSGKKPQLLSAARGTGADDLKRIKGVGPKLEQTLNGMGIYHFDQIAAWTEAELAWMDENLEGFKGRASRDEWVAQARDLAKG